MDQLAETLNRLIVLARSPDAGAAQAEMATYLGELQPWPGRSWKLFPNRSVVASVLQSSNRPAEALALAVESIRLQGRDDLADFVIDRTRPVFYNIATRALHSKRPDLARSVLGQIVEWLQDVSPLVEERALLDAIAFTEASPHNRAPIAAPTGVRPTVIYLAIWGDRFIESAGRNFLSCCVASGNIPALSRLGPVVLHIHTRSTDVDRILSSESIRTLSQYARVEVTPIPESFFIKSHFLGMGFWNRFILAALVYDGLMHAQRIGADFCQMGADILMSNGFLTAAKRRLTGTVEVLVTSPIRASEPHIFKELDALGCRRDNCWNIDSAVLYRASLKALHPFIRESFVRTSPTRLAVDPVFFYFPAADGFAARGFQFHCCMFNAGILPADLGCDFHTLDARLLSDLIAGRDPAKTCFIHADPPGDMYHVSVDAASGVATFGNFELSPQGAADSAVKWVNRYEDLDYLQWAVQQRFQYRAPAGVSLDIPSDCRNEAETVQEIIRLVQAKKSTLVQQIDSYRRPAAG